MTRWIDLALAEPDDFLLYDAAAVLADVVSMLANDHQLIDTRGVTAPTDAPESGPVALLLGPDLPEAWRRWIDSWQAAPRGRVVVVSTDVHPSPWLLQHFPLSARATLALDAIA